MNGDRREFRTSHGSIESFERISGAPASTTDKGDLLIIPRWIEEDFERYMARADAERDQAALDALQKQLDEVGEVLQMFAESLGLRPRKTDSLNDYSELRAYIFRDKR